MRPTGKGLRHAAGQLVGRGETGDALGRQCDPNAAVHGRFEKPDQLRQSQLTGRHQAEEGTPAHVPVRKHTRPFEAVLRRPQRLAEGPVEVRHNAGQGVVGTDAQHVPCLAGEPGIGAPALDQTIEEALLAL